MVLTNWGRVRHIFIGNPTIIGSDNGLLPGRCQAIIWTNVWMLLIGPLGTNFIDNFIEIHTFSSEKMHLKTSSTKWQPFCLSLNVLSHITCTCTPFSSTVTLGMCSTKCWQFCSGFLCSTGSWKTWHFFSQKIWKNTHFRGFAAAQSEVYNNNNSNKRYSGF